MKWTIVLFCLKIFLIIAINQLWIIQTQSLLVDFSYWEKVQRKRLVTTPNCVLTARKWREVRSRQMQCYLKRCSTVRVNTQLGPSRCLSRAIFYYFVWICGTKWLNHRLHCFEATVFTVYQPLIDADARTVDSLDSELFEQSLINVLWSFYQLIAHMLIFMMPSGTYNCIYMCMLWKVIKFLLSHF